MARWRLLIKFFTEFPSPWTQFRLRSPRLRDPERVFSLDTVSFPDDDFSLGGPPWDRFRITSAGPVYWQRSSANMNRSAGTASVSLSLENGSLATLAPPASSIALLQVRDIVLDRLFKSWSDHKNCWARFAPWWIARLRSDRTRCA